MNIHRGNSNIWNTPWCDVWGNIHSELNFPITVQPLPLTINQFWNHLSQDWNIDLINQIFSHQTTQSIVQIKVIPSAEGDVLVWKPANNGICTAKQAFTFLNAGLQLQLPTQGTRSVTPQAMQILQRVWKNKKCSPPQDFCLATNKESNSYKKESWNFLKQCPSGMLIL